MKGLIWSVILIIIIIVLVLVFSGDGKLGGNNDIFDSEDAEEAVLDDLKTSGLVSPSAEIEVKNVKQKDWSDACLGIEEVGKFCAQVITPGFEITLEAEEREFVYRTNQDGSFVVLAEQK